MKLSLIALLVFFTMGHSYARTQMAKCSQEPLSKEEVSKYQKMVRESDEFKNILKINAAITKVNISRCNKVEGNVFASYILLENILGKKCSINSMTFNFEIKKDKVKFKKMAYDKKRSIPKDLDRVLLIKTIEKIVKSKKAKEFFEKSSTCQADFNQTGNTFNWIMQLQENKKKFCFLEAASNAWKITEVKKLYAKPSKCSPKKPKKKTKKKSKKKK
jgi:hypothetical protein